MRRRSRWLTALLAAAVVLVAPAGAEGQAPAGDAVIGHGVASFFGPFDIDALSGPSGESPTGTASFDTDEVAISGTVNCLAVTGNVARFNLGGPRFAFFFQVTDNAGRGTPDTIAASAGPGNPNDCSPLVNPARTGVVLSGDISVVDATPLPTSKDQCKRDGWRSFGVFRNQGACVSFVATRSGPPRAG